MAVASPGPVGDAGCDAADTADWVLELLIFAPNENVELRAASSLCEPAAAAADDAPGPVAPIPTATPTTTPTRTSRAMQNASSHALLRAAGGRLGDLVSSHAAAAERNTMSAALFRTYMPTSPARTHVSPRKLSSTSTSTGCDSDCAAGASMGCVLEYEYSGKRDGDW